MNAPEVVSFLISELRDRNSDEARLCLTTVPNANSMVELAFARTIELFPDLDTVLVARTACSVLSKAWKNEPELQGFVECLLKRISDLTLQQISRVLFAAATSRSLDSEMRNRIYVESRRTVINSLNRYNEAPPRVVSKLAVGLATLGEGMADVELWKSISKHATDCASTMEPEHVQQVSFALSRVSSQNTDLTNALTRRAVLVSPIANAKTYVSLLVSLSRLPRDMACGDWRSFCRIFRDQFGIPVRGHISLGKLRECLEAVKFFPTDHQLRLARNALRDSVS